MATILSRTYVSQREKPVKDNGASATGGFGISRRGPKHGTLVDYAAFKGFTSSLLGKPTKVDPAQWAENVVDLKRVMTLMKHLHLLLVGSNEAMLRVAVELLTCRKAQKAVMWHEDWYGDDERREWFGVKVKEKLRVVLEALGKRSLEPAEEEEAPALVAERQRADEAEAKLAAADERIGKLLDELEDNLESRSQARLARLEEAATRHQGQMRELNRKLHASEDQGRQLQAQLDAAQTRIESSEASVAAANAAAAIAKETAAAAQKEAAAKQEEVAAAQEEAAAAKEEAREREHMEKRAAAATSETKVIGPVCTTDAANAASENAASASLASSAAKERRTEELEAQLAHLQAFVRASGLPDADPEALAESQQVKEALDTMSRAAEDTEIESSQAPRRRSIKPEGDTSDEQAAKLRAENKRLKVALEELQLRLKHLMGECRSKGLDEVSDIFDKVGLGMVLKTKTVWDRLYKDALERLDRVKNREASRAVLEELMPGVSLQHALEESEVPQQLQPLGGLHQPSRSVSHRQSMPSLLTRFKDDRTAIPQQLRTFDQQDCLSRHEKAEQTALPPHTSDQQDMLLRLHVQQEFAEDCADSLDQEQVQRRRQTMVTFDELSRMRGRSCNEEPSGAARGGAAGSGARRASFANGTAEGGTFGPQYAEAAASRTVFAATTTGICSDAAGSVLSAGSPQVGRPDKDDEQHARRMTAGIGSSSSAPGLAGGWLDRKPEYQHRILITDNSSSTPSCIHAGAAGGLPEHQIEHQPRRPLQQLQSASLSPPPMRQSVRSSEVRRSSSKERQLQSASPLSRPSMWQSVRSPEASPRECPEKQASAPGRSLNSAVSLPSLPMAGAARTSCTSMPIAGNTDDILAATQMMQHVFGQRRSACARKGEKVWRP